MKIEKNNRNLYTSVIALSFFHPRLVHLCGGRLKLVFETTKRHSRMQEMKKVKKICLVEKYRIGNEKQPYNSTSVIALAFSHPLL